MIITVLPAGDPGIDTSALADAVQQLHTAGGGVLQLEAGLYMVEKIDDQSCIEMKNVANIRVQGYSQTTVKLAPRNSLGDCHIFHVWNSADISFNGFKIDGSRFDHTLIDEQSHGIQVTDSQNVTIEDMEFYQLYGDGIRLLGISSTSKPWTEEVSIRDSRFLENGRSGIAVQRGNRSVKISSNYFKGTSDQDIDFEPSGQANAPHDFRIVDNEIIHSTPALSVTLGGFNAEPAKNIVFANNILSGGAVRIGEVADSIISNNVIIGPSDNRVVDVVGSIKNLIISGNRIIANGGTEAAVRIATQGSASPSGIICCNNDIECKKALDGILIYSADKVSVIGNRLKGFGTNSGVKVRAVTANQVVYGLLISSNAISNFLRGGHVNISAAGAKVSELAFTGNVLSDDQATPTQATGLWNETPTKIDFLLTSGNLFGRGIVNQVV